jgi:hypothetical protein
MLWYLLTNVPDKMDLWNEDSKDQMIKDQMINVVKRWYSDIADLRTKHRLVVVVRDNAGENKSQEVKDFLSQKEFGIISAHLMSNGRMDLLNPHQFDYVNRQNSHSRIRTWRKILVQGDYGRH